MVFKGITPLAEEALAAAVQAGRPVLAGWARAISGFDPIALFALAGRAGDARLWIAADGAMTLVGLGTAWGRSGPAAAKPGHREGDGSPPTAFAGLSQAWQDLLDHHRFTAGSGWPGPILMGGARFDPWEARTDLWGRFPDWSMILPTVQFVGQGERCWVSVHRLVHPDEHVEPVTADLHGAGEWALDLARRAPAAPVERAGAGLDTGAAANPRAAGRRAASPAAGPPQRVEVPLQLTDRPDPVEWKRAVAAAAAHLSRSPLNKVVLARQVQCGSAIPPDPAAALDYLRDQYPNCCLFAIRCGDHVFLGATPERLVRLTGGRVEVDCLAGSIARGQDCEHDQALARKLLASAKDGEEHAVVLDAILAALAPLCRKINVPAGPGLLRLANVQHLHTPVTATAAPDVTLLDLVARLHPTPAVAGHPVPEALAYLRRHEGPERGWYAGPVGWIDAAGDGEFVVALRSALLSGDTATLFAGNGIMPDSDPESEYEETCLKLRPMLAALAQPAAQGGIQSP